MNKKILWAALTVFAISMAVLWLIIWPENKALGKGFIETLILRWGHSLTWLLLGIGFCFKAIDRMKKTSDILMQSGGIIYILFILNSVL